MLRNFKPERSIREEEFVPGIDPGVREWLVVRQSGRDAQLRGSKIPIVTCDVKYKLNQFWRDQIFLFNKTQQGSSKNLENIALSEESQGSASLIEFQAMLAARCSFEDIVPTALKKRNNDFIDLAIKHGVNINHRTGHSRRTMLQHVCRDGDTKKCMHLLKLGCRVNITDTHGSTALHLAIQSPSTFHPIEIIEALLTRGAKVNLQDKHGHTPLHLACIVGSKEIIEVLLKNHALPYILDKKGKMAIDHTKSQLNRQFCELVATYCLRKHQERMWSHVASLKFVASVIKLATPSCDVCLRTIPECLDLKSKRYRYWLFAHHRMAKDYVEDRPGLPQVLGPEVGFEEDGSGSEEENDLQAEYDPFNF